MMINQILLYVGAFLPLAWGISHLFPTRAVVAGFGQLTQDNKRIITMEWINEGVCLIFIGLLTGVVTLYDRSSTVSKAILGLCIIELNVLSSISMFTGALINFLPYKLCPVFFTGSSVLIFLGAYLEF